MQNPLNKIPSMQKQNPLNIIASEHAITINPLNKTPFITWESNKKVTKPSDPNTTNCMGV